MEQAVQKAQKDVTKLAAFWPDATRPMQERHLLREDIRDCSYVIRHASSPKDPKHIASISVKVNGTILHFRVLVELSENGTPLYHIPSNQPMPSNNLVDLIERYYYTNPLEGNGNHAGQVVPVKDCYLRIPSQNKLSQPSGELSGGDKDYVGPGFPQPPVRRCSCGIPLDATKLPDGWSVHRSRDPVSEGMLYFKNSEGQTSWLPHPKVDSKCNSWSYLNYGRLNAEVFVKYNVQYDANSELMRRLINSVKA